MDTLDQRIERCTEAGILGLRRAIDAGPGWRLILLCDPTLDDPLHAEAQSLELPLQPVYVHTPITTSPKLYLIDIDDESAHEPFVNRSIRTAVEQALQPHPPTRRSRSVCAWLITSLPALDIARSLSRRAGIIDGLGRRRLFRFWDPRTTQHLPQLLPDIPLGSWVPSTSWGFIDSFGNWQLLPWRTEQPEAHLSATPSWEAANLYSMVNQVIQRLPISDTHSLTATTDDIKQALRTGAELGLQDEADRISFAVHRIQYRVPIERSQRIANLLANVRNHDVNYRNHTEDFDDNEWAEIQAEIPVWTAAEPGDKE